ncbi:MAG: hypothetical protein HZB38_05355 [Planctomycetes bacterium]|nr:hypothetical protein [Planctomycetota bacterium]
MRLVLAAILVAYPALADGMAFKGRDWHALASAIENEQIALIRHENGVQRMLLSVDLEMADEDHGVWIFPLPCPGSSIEADIAGEFPRLMGADPRVQARQALSRGMTAVRAFTVVPLFFEIGCLLPSLSRARSLGLTVHSEVEKFGLHVGVVSAGDLSELSAYIGTRAAALDARALASMSPYCDGRSSFVVTWITSKTELRAASPDGLNAGSGRKPCVDVSFQTPEPFFPMRATSGYGEAEVRLRLFVIGHVAPVADGYERALWRDYFVQPARERLQPFVADGLLPEGDFPYTVFSGGVEARALTADLRFKAIHLPGLKYSSAVASITARSGLPLIFATVALLSWLAGGVVGLTQFGRWREPARLGLWHMATIAGLFGALRATELSTWERRPTAAGDPAVHERNLRRRFLAYFVLTFVVLSVIVQVAITLPLRFS